MMTIIQAKVEDVPGLIPVDALMLSDGAKQVLGEVQSIAIGFMNRTAQVESQLNNIVATAYVNLKKRADQGDKWSADLVVLMDQQIKQLKDISEKYFVDVARATR